MNVPKGRAPNHSLSQLGARLSSRCVIFIYFYYYSTGIIIWNNCATDIMVFKDTAISSV